MSSEGAESVPGRRVTSTDVAREAGLSRATVSYVLNRDPRQTIPEATRRRVLDAAARLGYRPYGPARLLRGARSSVVLMLTTGLEHASDLVAADIVRRLGAALRDRGLHLVWQLGVEERDAAIDLAPAVVLTSAADDEPVVAELARQFSVPVRSAFPGLDAFIGAAAVAQVEHLHQRDRRHIAYIGPARAELGPTSRIRLSAARAATRRLGITAPICVTLPDERTAAAEVLRGLLTDHEDVDAIAAYNDEVALAVLAAAHDISVAVPDRLAVIGVDNHPYGRLAIPALSSVASDVTEFIEQLADGVLGLTQGESRFDVRLPQRAGAIIRHST